MTEIDPKTTWLPNLVGGVSMWKLAPDLNEARFFEGRLLVPETEGSDSLPARVTWDVAGLVPLAEARASRPEETQVAIADFLACLEKVAAEFANASSGYSKYREAFTVPALEGAGARNYYFDPTARKLRVINWGASPRTLGGEEALVFGYGSFGALIGKERGVPHAPVMAAAAAATVVTSLSDEERAKKAEDEKKKADEEKKKAVAAGRPWWIWLLVVLGILGVVLLILMLLRACAKPIPPSFEADGAASADGSVGQDGATGGGASDDGGGGGAASAGGGAGGAGGAGGSSDDSGGAADGAARPSDAATDGKRGDAGASSGDASAGDSGGASSGGSASSAGGGGGGGGGSAGSGSVTVNGGGASAGGAATAGGAPSDGRPHRSDFHPDALRWKLISGADLLDPSSPATAEGDTFEVTLKKGASFEKVRVQYQDKAGKWHTH